MVDMSLTIPNLTQMEALREEYKAHLQSCQATIDAIPEEYRMARRNAGFHADASAVAALGMATGVNGPKLLEIGVWKAATLTFFLKKNGPQSTACGLDIFQFENQVLEASNVIYSQDLDERVKLLSGPSSSIPETLFKHGQSFDIVHIDGSHLFMDACRDILMYYHFLKPGGWLIVDDYLDHQHSPEVKFAVDMLRQNNIINDPNQGFIDGWSNYFIQKRVI